MNAGESRGIKGVPHGRPCPSTEGGLEVEGKRRSGAPRGERPSHWACAARRIDVTRAFRRSAPLTFGEGAFPLVDEGMEMRRTPRLIKNRGGGALVFSRRLFDM